MAGGGAGQPDRAATCCRPLLRAATGAGGGRSDAYVETVFDGFLPPSFDSKLAAPLVSGPPSWWRRLVTELAIEPSKELRRARRRVRPPVCAGPLLAS